MKLPFIDSNGGMPTTEELKKFGILFDERSQSISTLDYDDVVIPLDLGGVPDTSGYIGHGQAIPNPPEACPEHIAQGNLTTLEDIVNHIYYSRATASIAKLNAPINMTLEVPAVPPGTPLHIYTRVLESGDAEVAVSHLGSSTHVIIPKAASSIPYKWFNVMSYDNGLDEVNQDTRSSPSVTDSDHAAWVGWSYVTSVSPGDGMNTWSLANMRSKQWLLATGTVPILSIWCRGILS